MCSHVANVDPLWKENATCSCKRCVRSRTASTVTETCMARYRQWIDEAGLQVKPHQLDGMMWVLYHELYGEHRIGRGGIIADEMGLGKTILMLGAIVTNFKRRTLIVVPPALLQQWKSVIEKFGVGLIGHTVVYHGYGVKNLTQQKVEESYIVLTTYGMITKRKKEESMLTKIPWSRVIYDEAHHMRNPTRIYAGAKKLEASIKWMVTGTPIQNSSKDLSAIINLCGIPITQSMRAISDEATFATFKKNLSFHLLRRTKKEVGIKLPTVNTHIIEVPWAGENEKIVAAQIHSSLSFSDVNIANVDRIIAYLNNSPLPMLTRSRQVCILPSMLAKVFNKMKRSDIIPDNIHLRDIETASKYTSILRTLFQRSPVAKKNNIPEYRRKLVFCHYRDEIDALQFGLKKLGISCAVIDGRTKKRERSNNLAYIPDYNEISSVCKQWHDALSSDIWRHINSYLGPEVLLLQIQTACEGLNLQHFQEIYFTSPHWNPAVEDQAVARAHRIGQKRPVDVFHFIMDGFGDGTKSIDQYCELIQRTKRSIADQLISKA